MNEITIQGQIRDWITNNLLFSDKDVSIQMIYRGGPPFEVASTRSGNFEIRIPREDILHEDRDKYIKQVSLILRHQDFGETNHIHLEGVGYWQDEHIYIADLRTRFSNDTGVQIKVLAKEGTTPLANTKVQLMGWRAGKGSLLAEGRANSQGHFSFRLEATKIESFFEASSRTIYVQLPEIKGQVASQKLTLNSREMEIDLQVNFPEFHLPGKVINGITGEPEKDLQVEFWLQFQGEAANRIRTQPITSNGGFELKIKLDYFPAVEELKAAVYFIKLRQGSICIYQEGPLPIPLSTLPQLPKVSLSAFREEQVVPLRGEIAEADTFASVAERFSMQVIALTGKKGHAIETFKPNKDLRFEGEISAANFIEPCSSVKPKAHLRLLFDDLLAWEGKPLGLGELTLKEKISVTLPVILRLSGKIKNLISGGPEEELSVQLLAQTDDGTTLLLAEQQSGLNGTFDFSVRMDRLPSKDVLKKSKYYFKIFDGDSCLRQTAKRNLPESWPTTLPATTIQVLRAENEVKIQGQILADGLSVDVKDRLQLFISVMMAGERHEEFLVPISGSFTFDHGLSVQHFLSPCIEAYPDLKFELYFDRDLRWSSPIYTLANFPRSLEVNFEVPPVLFSFQGKIHNLKSDSPEAGLSVSCISTSTDSDWQTITSVLGAFEIRVYESSKALEDFKDGAEYRIEVHNSTRQLLIRTANSPLPAPGSLVDIGMLHLLRMEDELTVAGVLHVAGTTRYLQSTSGEKAFFKEFGIGISKKGEEETLLEIKYEDLQENLHFKSEVSAKQFIEERGLTLSKLEFRLWRRPDQLLTTGIYSEPFRIDQDLTKLSLTIDFEQIPIPLIQLEGKLSAANEEDLTKVRLEVRFLDQPNLIITSGHCDLNGHFTCPISQQKAQLVSKTGTEKKVELVAISDTQRLRIDYTDTSSISSHSELKELISSQNQTALSGIELVMDEDDPMQNLHAATLFSKIEQMLSANDDRFDAFEVDDDYLHLLLYSFNDQDGFEEVEHQHLVWFIKSLRLEQTISIEHADHRKLVQQFLFALFTQRLPTALGAILKLEPAAIREAIGRARKVNVIPATSPEKAKNEVELFLKILRAEKVNRILKGSMEFSGNILNELLIASGIEESDKRISFIKLYTEHKGDIESFWSKLPNDYWSDKIERIQTNIQLAVFSLNHLPMVKLLDPQAEELTPELAWLKTYQEGHQSLAWLGSIDIGSTTDSTTKGWLDLVKLTGVPAEIWTEVPEGELEVILETYAEILHTSAALAFPDSQLSNAIHTNENLQRFLVYLKQNGLNLSSIRVEKEVDLWLVQQAEPIPQLEETRTQIIEEVKKWQRASRLAPRNSPWHLVEHLVKSGWDAAVKIHQVGRTAFIRKWVAIRQNVDKLQETASEEALRKEADSIYQKAWRKSMLTKQLMSRYTHPFNHLKFKSEATEIVLNEQKNTGTHRMTSFENPVKDNFEQLKDLTGIRTGDLRTLFGAMDQYECPHCQSFYSAAAYFTDLLLWLDGRPTSDNSASALDILFQRRPDLKHITLNCRNTHEILPYIDLVNEILEWQVLQLNSEAADPDDLKRLNTNHNSQELKNHPEHLQPQAYVHLALAANNQAQAAPMRLPWDFWLEEGRTYLEQAKWPLYQLLSISKPTVETPEHSLHDEWSQFNDLEIACEFLHISPVERELLFPRIESERPWLLLGYASEKWTDESKEEWVWTEHLAQLKQLQTTFGTKALESQNDQATLSLLWELLDTRFVQQTRDQEGRNRISLTEKEINEPCSLHLSNYTAATFIHLLRFERLRRKLGWTPHELDLALCTFSADFHKPELHVEMITQLALLSNLKEQMDVPIIELLAWQGNMDTRSDLIDIVSTANVGFRYPDVRSLFQQTFNDNLRSEKNASFALRGDRLELYRTSEDDKTLTITSFQEELVSLLAISAAELTAWVGEERWQVKDFWDLATLSALYRRISLCKVLGLSVWEYAAIHHFSDVDPFPFEASTEPDHQTNLLHSCKFIKIGRDIQASNFGVEELAFLLKNEKWPDSAFEDWSLANQMLARSINEQFLLVLEEFDPGIVPTDEQFVDLMNQLLSRSGQEELEHLLELRQTNQATPDAIKLTALAQDLKELFFADEETGDSLSELTALLEPTVMSSWDSETAYASFKDLIWPLVRSWSLYRTQVTTLTHILGTELDLSQEYVWQLLEKVSGSRESSLLEDLLWIREKSPHKETEALDLNLIPLKSGTYQFSYDSADTNVKISIYKEGNSVPQNTDTSVSLVGDQKYKISITTEENKEINPARLCWKLDREEKKTIPAALLFRIESFELAVQALDTIRRLGLYIRAFDLPLPFFEQFHIHRSATFLKASDWVFVDGESRKESAERARFQKWEQLNQITQFRKSFPASISKWTGLLEHIFLNSPAEVLREHLSNITGWNRLVLEEYIQHKNLKTLLEDQDKRSTLLGSLLRMRFELQALSEIGWTASQLASIINDLFEEDKDLRIASTRQIKQWLQSKYDPNHWAKVAPVIREGLREQQRDALLHYITHHLSVSEVEQLYGLLLIDLEMGACQMTSRLKQATSSVQLFIQRCFLGMEDPQKLTFSEEDRQEWKWRKRYRVWEANQKVFLYPENWIEPELRDDKTPIFRAIEDDLLQEEVTPESTERAFIKYLEELNKIARLEIISQVKEETEKGNVLHVLGRTHGLPQTYHYRQRKPNNHWTPWQKVEVEIEGDHILMTRLSGKMYLFWLTFLDKAKPKLADQDSSFQYFDVLLNWSQLDRELWTPRRVSPYPISMEWDEEVYGGDSTLARDKRRKKLMNLQADHDRGRLFLYPGSIKAGYSFNENVWKHLLQELRSYNFSKKNFEEIKLKGEHWLKGLGIRAKEEILKRHSQGGQNPIQAAAALTVLRHFLDRYFEALTITENIEFQHIFYKDVFLFTGFDGNIVVLPENKRWLRAIVPPGTQPDGMTASGIVRPGKRSSIALLQEKNVYSFVSNMNSERLINQPILEDHFILTFQQETATPYSWQLPLWKDHIEPFYHGFLHFDAKTFLLTNIKTVEPEHILLEAEKKPAINLDYGVYHQVASQVKQEVAPAARSRKEKADPGSLQTKPVQTHRIRQIYSHKKTQMARATALPVNASYNNRISSTSLQETLAQSYSLEEKPSTVSIQESIVPLYRIELFYHPFVQNFRETVFTKGVEGLLRMEKQTQLRPIWATQNLSNKTFPTLSYYVETPHPIERISYDLHSAYGQYNWELFFHLPFLIATRLSQNHQFEEAQKWLHYIFDPFQFSIADKKVEAPNTYWNFQKFRDLGKPNRIADLIYLLGGRTALNDLTQEEITNLRKGFVQQIEEWGHNPFQPHWIARQRPGAYQKAVVFKYLENLINWADHLFRQDSMESIAEATLLYIAANEILGPRPDLIAKKQDRTAFLQEEQKTYEKAFASDQSKDQLYELQIRWEELLPETLEEELSDVPLEAPSVQLLFCIPPNQKVIGFWDTVEDRLYKIRHCMNIEGLERSLPLFQPEIDPTALVRAAASGIDLSTAINDLFTPVPRYRFAVLLQKAYAFCGELKSLGNQLLGALEKKDAETLALLRSTHEVNLLGRIKDIKKNQVKEIEANLAALDQAEEITKHRFEFYNKPDRKSDKEKNYTDNLTIANRWQLGAQIADSLAAVLFAFPQITVNILGTETETGGMHLGNIASAIGRISGAVAGQYSHSGTMASIEANYDRRKEDWDFQKEQAEMELRRLEKQREATAIRKTIAERELNNHLKQIEQSKEIEFFMKHKFTNKQLYAWMTSQISTLYFQSYRLAYDLAKQAEKALKFELANDQLRFLKYGHWDSLRKGLLAGDRLHQDLQRMETAHLKKNERLLEIGKHISLWQLSPEALMKLREEGTCIFDLPEYLFDIDFPGHYQRRIKSISLTIPAVVGPYTSINAKLTLLRSRIRKEPSHQGYSYKGINDPRFSHHLVAGEAIAISSSQDDHGMFELNFRDERYLPFEGAGTISSWQLDLTSAFPMFDYNTISDVVLNLKYTAKDGGSAFSGLVKEYLTNKLKEWMDSLENKQQLLQRLVSLREVFPDSWRKLFDKPAHSSKFTLGIQHFPFLFRKHRIQLRKVVVYLQLRSAQSGAPVTIHLDNHAPEATPKAIGTDRKLWAFSFESNRSISAKEEEDFSIAFQVPEGEDPSTLALDSIDNIFLLFRFMIENKK